MGSVPRYKARMAIWLWTPFEICIACIPAVEHSPSKAGSVWNLVKLADIVRERVGDQQPMYQIDGRADHRLMRLHTLGTLYIVQGMKHAFVFAFFNDPPPPPFRGGIKGIRGAVETGDITPGLLFCTCLVSHMMQLHSYLHCRDVHDVLVCSRSGLHERF